MKKSVAIGVGVVIVVVLAAGGYALMRSPSKPASTATTTGSGSNSGQTAPAVNNAVLVTKVDPQLGQYLAEPSGMPLYTYPSDSPGVSNCTGSCLADWPAYQAKGSTAKLPAGVGVITRSDNGQIQYTFNGMPLYYFVSDSSGHVTGEGVNDFHIAKPAAPASPQEPAPTTQPSDNSSSSGYPY